MPRRVVASLILCVALLAQAVAMGAAGALSRDDAAMGGVPCGFHAAISAPSQTGDLGQNRAGGAPHDHQSCSMCLLGVGAAALDSGAKFFVLADREWRRPEFFSRDEPSASPPLNRGAPARASPSFS